METLSRWTGRGDRAAVDLTDEPEEDQLFFALGWLSAESITSPKYPPPPPELGELWFCTLVSFCPVPEGGAGRCTDAGTGTVAGCDVGCTGAGTGCCGRMWDWALLVLLMENSSDERGDGREVVTDICGMFGCPISVSIFL